MYVLWFFKKNNFSRFLWIFFNSSIIIWHLHKVHLCPFKGLNRKMSWEGWMIYDLFFVWFWWRYIKLNEWTPVILKAVKNWQNFAKCLDLKKSFSISRENYLLVCHASEIPRSLLKCPITKSMQFFSFHTLPMLVLLKCWQIPLGGK